MESEFSHSQSTSDGDRNAINVFETALAAAEDETDVAAAKTAKEEAVADLAEFDEAIPIVELNDVKLSKADMEVQALEKQVKINGFFEFNFILFLKLLYIQYFNIFYFYL